MTIYLSSIQGNHVVLFFSGELCDYIISHNLIVSQAGALVILLITENNLTFKTHNRTWLQAAFSEKYIGYRLTFSFLITVLLHLWRHFFSVFHIRIYHNLNKSSETRNSILNGQNEQEATAMLTVLCALNTADKCLNQLANMLTHK